MHELAHACSSGLTARNDPPHVLLATPTHGDISRRQQRASHRRPARCALSAAATSAATAATAKLLPTARRRGGKRPRRRAAPRRIAYHPARVHRGRRRSLLIRIERARSLVSHWPRVLSPPPPKWLSGRSIVAVVVAATATAVVAAAAGAVDVVSARQTTSWRRPPSLRHCGAQCGRRLLFADALPMWVERPTRTSPLSQLTVSREHSAKSPDALLDFCSGELRACALCGRSLRK